VAYTDDTIKVAEEKLEGVLSELKPKWVGYDAIAITLLITRTAQPAENAAPSEGTKDWLKN
jgi:hypothetical protein